jgi:CheY-like chemotaxis protein
MAHHGTVCRSVNVASDTTSNPAAREDGWRPPLRHALDLICERWSLLVRTRVLIVEDHCDNRESLGILFESWGFEVALALDGEHAIALATTWRPHVVLLDLGLPGIQGEEVAMIIKAAPRPPHVIAYTGYERLEEKALVSGCDAFILKPGLETLAALMASIRNARAITGVE